MAVAIDTASLALDFIPQTQRELDRATGGRRRFQIHRVSAHATIPFPESEIWRQSRSVLENFYDSMAKQGALESFDLSVAKQEALEEALESFHVSVAQQEALESFGVSLAKHEALNWQADPDDDLGDAAVLHHLHQQAATVPLISQSDQGNSATTLAGSALSPSIQARTQGRLLSSFHSFSIRVSSLGLWNSVSGYFGLGKGSDWTALFPSGLDVLHPRLFNCVHPVHEPFEFIVCEGPPRDNQVEFWQLQVDVVDLFSQRTVPNSRPRKRRQTAFNQFLQLSHSPVVEDRGNPLSHAKRFNGVRYRPDRRTWVAEMKPPKHKTKQDFGNFKSEAEAARAVDAAFYHYGKPHLFNFRDTSLQFLSTRTTAPPGLDEKAKVKFVREEAKLLLEANTATSPLHSTPTNSLQITESPGRCPSGHFRSLSEISLPFSCSSSDEVDAAVSPSEPWVLIDSICDISTTGVLTNLESRNSVQIAEQEWIGPKTHQRWQRHPTL